MRQRIIVVQGGQWGSEGKGMVAAALAERRQVKFAVRTGTVNAGHTVYYKGKGYKMQQIPTAWVHEDVELVIGAGAYIAPEILNREIAEINFATGKDVRERLWIDNNAGLHLSGHQAAAKFANRHHLIGATGKGCSEAVVGKIRNRGNGVNLFKDWCKAGGGTDSDFVIGGLKTMVGFDRLQFTDTSRLLNAAYDSGESILLEGTQGSHLDLHLGPYPYTTHKQTQAAQWAMESGLGLGADYEIFLVCRTFPIRVAGNSGPMPMETNWPDVVRGMNMRMEKLGFPPMIDEGDLQAWEGAVAAIGEQYQLTSYDALHHEYFNAAGREKFKVFLSECHAQAMNTLTPACKEALERVFEFTTVTKKLRRVARWDDGTVQEAIRWNRPHAIVLSFFNYWFPETWGQTEVDAMNDEYQRVVEGCTRELGVPITHITTGPNDEHFLRAGRGVTWQR